MKLSHCLFLPLFVGALATAPCARAQDPAAPKPTAPRPDAPAPAAAPVAAAAAAPSAGDQALLGKALAKMAGITGVRFKTVEVQDNAMMRQIRAQMPAGMGGDEDVEVSGTWCQGVLSATAGADGDDVVRYRGRTVVRADGAWKLRGDQLPGGAPMPFLFDPQLLFEALAALPADALEVAHAEDAERSDVALRVLTVTLDGTAAADLLGAGVFPRVVGGPMMMRIGGMSMGGGDAEVTVDLAFSVDAESGLVHRVRIKAYEESPFAGQMRVAVGGAGGGGEEAAEAAAANDEAAVKETDEQGHRVFKGGLPVRKLGDSLSMVDFDVRLREHEQTFANDLDAAAKRLLKLDG